MTKEKENKKSTDTKYLYTQLSKHKAFRISEAYKSIRTNLLFAMSPYSDKTILITSAEPNAGKSITSANIGITMAQTGAKVLLIDADMRNPSQHKIFRLSNNNGLSKLISGLSPVDASSIYHDVSPNLDLITAGPTPPNPSELLGSINMLKILEQIKTMYDYILIDTPPVNIVSDSLVMLSEVSRVLLVARQKQTVYDDLKRTVNAIRGLNGNILGVVVTDVREKFKKSSNYYNRYYDYYES